MVDDLHRLAQRHQDGVSQLLEGLHERQQVVVLAGRLPLPDRFDWPLLHLGNLAPNDAKHLLGEHLEDDLRQQVAKALDGHPMAINLYREGEPLPEAGEDIQAFVKQTMLNGLTEEGLDGLDTMVLFPRPLSSEVAPGIESIEELDERALLRWSPDGLDVEVQHLVRSYGEPCLTKNAWSSSSAGRPLGATPRRARLRRPAPLSSIGLGP